MARLHSTGRSRDLALFSSIAGGRARSMFVTVAVRAVFPHGHALRAESLRAARAEARTQPAVSVLEQTAG